MGVLAQSAGKAGSRGKGPSACVYWLSTRLGLVTDETHLSAEKAQASEDSWFPRADAHARRPDDAEAPSRQGSEALDRLMRPRGATGPRQRRGRLSRSADFDRV